MNTAFINFYYIKYQYLSLNINIKILALESRFKF
jgi:hypothetical protein